MAYLHEFEQKSVVFARQDRLERVTFQVLFALVAIAAITEALLLFA